MTYWLILDATYLCHRAFHARKHEIAEEAVINGFIVDLLSLQERYDPRGWVFCFDAAGSLRKEVYPEYKATRHDNATKEEQLERRRLRAAVKKLAKEVLPSFGFSNIHYAKGFEADDFIAKACEISSANKQEAVIVGADKDMYQLLGRWVKMFNPNSKKEYSAEDFRNEWGLEPLAWVDVKAIAGCSSDNIEGVPRVGEKTAAKFLCGALPSHHKTYSLIVSSTSSIKERNMGLVRLPYEGTPDKPMEEWKPDLDTWYRIKCYAGLDTDRDSIAYRRRKGR